MCVQDANNAKREWTATQKTRDLLGTIQHRAEAVFRLLNLQVTLCLLSREPDVTHVRSALSSHAHALATAHATAHARDSLMALVDQEEEEALSTLLRYSHACNLIGDHLTPQQSGCPTGSPPPHSRPLALCCGSR